MKKKITKKTVPEVRTLKKNLQKPSPDELNGGIKKEYLKSSPACNVTFTLPKEAAPDARMVTLVGDFNNWDPRKTPMKKLKNGDFRLKVKLARKNHYKFRYLIDAKRWENDWHADTYVPNSFGDEDSVVDIQ